MPKPQITPELLRAALAYIPASLPRDEWARVAMAIKSEFPDETGFALFDEWSQQAADGYDVGAVRGTWRSIKAGGGVGVGTLLHLAKEHGFKPPKMGLPPVPPSREVLAQRQRENAERERSEQAHTEAAQARACAEARALFDDADETGESGYLARKGVHPYGVRFAAGGWLLVPVCNEAGELVNLQRIAPIKPTDGGPDKLFLKGGRKRGCWHWCGDPAGAGVLLVAEGYATAASLHEAAGRPVAVAFDAGNLGHVARALRQRYPAALIVVCGDDDRDTEAKSGANPGRDKATAAAQAVRGLAIFPERLPAGSSDFNDMHLAVGLAAVRDLLEEGIDVHQAGQRAAQATDVEQASTDRGSGERERAGAFDAFTVDEQGVWHQGADQDGKPKAPEWVCSRLEIEALTRDQDGGGWGYLLAFADPLGNIKQWAMPSRMLAGDGTEARATLMSMGLRIATAARARNLLTQYIQTRKPGTFATCTDRVGWHGRSQR